MVSLSSIAWSGVDGIVAAASQGSGEIFSFLPYISKPEVINLDFTVMNLEVYQSVQTEAHDVPLVAGKTAVVRIYAQLLQGTSPDNVTVSLSAARDGNPLGTIQADPGTIPGSTSRGDYDSTFNVALPDAWLSGNVQLTATVDSDAVLTENNEGNNQYGRTVTFNNVPTLQVRLIPIDYLHTGLTDPGDYPGQGADLISDWIERSYPVGEVDMEVRPHYVFAGNLENVTACTSNPPSSACDWLNLLNEMYALKLSDGEPSDSPIVYYGLIPIRNGSNQWFHSGIAGIGWVSDPGEVFREAIGLNLGANDDTGVLAAHEIGHNLGRRHAPCGGAGGVDPSYPYSGASIGQYATDIRSATNISFYTPSDHVDMMSYCSPEWISDYTYKGLYNNQRTYGGALLSTTADHLIFRASLGADDTVAFAPTYMFATQSASSAPADSGYMLQMLDVSGAVIATQPVAVREAEEEGISLRAVLAAVPMPNQPVAAIRLVNEAGIVAERPLSSPNFALQTTVTINQTPEAISLNWGGPQTPAIVRYTTDDGASWTTYGVDVTGGSFTVARDNLVEGEDGRFQIILANTQVPTILTAELDN
jgi:hypothetical protein